MADDWIKMRTNLQTHPKVVRMASALDADKCPQSVRACLVVGALHAVWGLFDTHSVDGELVGYTPESLNDFIRVPGIAQAMIDVGWLTFDGAQTLALPEFGDHNGQSAKRRGQESKRKRGARDADKRPQEKRTNVRKVSASDADKKRTREEKRREDSKTPCSPPAGGRRKRACAMPNDFTPDQTCEARASDVGADLDWELKRFRDWVDANGKTYKDWQAAFRNWLGNAKPRRPSSSNGGDDLRHWLQGGAA